MTQPHQIDREAVALLIERLRLSVVVKDRRGADVTVWSNPDGPAAADLIERLAAPEAVAWRYRLDSSCPWSLAFNEPEQGLFDVQALAVTPVQG